MVIELVTRDKESFMEKKSIKNIGTLAGYKVALNNFESFFLEKYAKADYITELKTLKDEQVYDVLQSWINWNKSKTPRTVRNYFSRFKKYLYYRGIKLDQQEINEELDFPSSVQEELYPLTLDDIHKLISVMKYKHKTQFICQLSALMRIGEIVQLRKKHLIIDKPNIIVKIPPTIAKFSKARTTFFSKEASVLLRPILRQIDDNDLVFGSNDNKMYAETNSEQIFRRNANKVGLDMKYETTGRYIINTHSFRAYGITKLSRQDPNFAKMLAGQKGYLLEYDRLSVDDKLELYEKLEKHLIIDDKAKQKARIKELEAERTEIESLKDERESRDKEVRDLLKMFMKANPENIKLLKKFLES